MALPKVSSSLKREQVVDLLRAEILSGGLRPGERIVESQLARELGVSQTPVREAFAALSREGLVVKLDHRGTFVSSLKADELRDLLTLRAVLEGYCARLVAQSSTDREIESLAGVVENMSTAARAGKLEQFVEYDLDFHQRLYALSGNGLLQEVLLGLQQRMRLALAFFVNAVYSQDLNEVAADHLVLLDVLRERDPAAAEAVATAHVLEGLGALGGDDADGPAAAVEGESGPGSRAAGAPRRFVNS
jgi:DNA-binding GntR family transcriptional regulator